MDEADSDTDAAEVAELEQQIDMCNTQITDLQQKLIDADQGDDSFVVLFSTSLYVWLGGIAVGCWTCDQ